MLVLAVCLVDFVGTIILEKLRPNFHKIFVVLDLDDKTLFKVSVY